MKSLEQHLEVMERAARNAGEYLLNEFGHAKIADTKSDGSLVTQQDFTAQDIIIKTLEETIPYNVLSEELSEVNTLEGRYWIVDPLDGTTNYSRGIPLWAISIALMQDNETLGATTYMPLQDEMFTAWRGHGAHLNGKKLEAKIRKPVIVGYDHGYAQESIDEIAILMAKTIPTFGYSRDFSSTVLALSYSAFRKETEGNWALQ